MSGRREFPRPHSVDAADDPPGPETMQAQAGLANKRTRPSTVETSKRTRSHLCRSSNLGASMAKRRHIAAYVRPLTSSPTARFARTKSLQTCRRCAGSTPGNGGGGGGVTGRGNPRGGSEPVGGAACGGGGGGDVRGRDGS